MALEKFYHFSHMNLILEQVATWTTIAPPWIALIITLVGTGLLLWTLSLQRKTLVDQQIITKLQVQGYYKSILPVLESIQNYTINTMNGVTTIEARLLLEKNKLLKLTYEAFNQDRFTLQSFNITEKDVMPVNSSLLIHFTYVNLNPRDKNDEEFYLFKLYFQNSEGNKYFQNFFYNQSKGIRNDSAEIVL